jgi:hypothetical protein
MNNGIQSRAERSKADRDIVRIPRHARCRFWTGSRRPYRATSVSGSPGWPECSPHHHHGFGTEYRIAAHNNDIEHKPSHGPFRSDFESLVTRMARHSAVSPVGNARQPGTLTGAAPDLLAQFVRTCMLKPYPRTNMVGSIQLLEVPEPGHSCRRHPTAGVVRSDGFVRARAINFPYPRAVVTCICIRHKRYVSSRSLLR